MVEDVLKMIRRSVKIRFIQKRNEFFKEIVKKINIEILKRKFDKFIDVSCIVEGKYDIYLMYFIEEEITVNENGKI